MIALSDLARETGLTVDTLLIVGTAAAEEYRPDGATWHVSDEFADVVRAQVREYRHDWTEVVWTEDGPTLNADHAHTYGQHGLCDGVPVTRVVWPDGDPVPGPAGDWSPCPDCGPDGLPIREEEAS